MTAYFVLRTPSGPVRFRVNTEARDDEPVLVREEDMETCFKCGEEDDGHNRNNCSACRDYGPQYNLHPCHNADPRVCVRRAGHDGECDTEEAMMQFYSGGDGGRYA